MKKEMSNKMQTLVNMFASAVTYIISLFISFFLSPYIVKNIGVDANGFIGLANNFISYAALITIALNTLSGRFVTINIYQKKYDEANKYFSSVFYSNIFLSVIISIVGFVIVLFLDSFIDVSSELLPDVRMLFSLLFINCVIGTMSSVFSVATFARNKLYLNSLRTIESNLIRVLLIVLLFNLFVPKLYYVAVASVVATVYCTAINIYYTKKLLPEIKIRKDNFELSKIKELLAGGVWATINRLGQILLDGLDLLITNVFINAVSMGVLSLSKTVPSTINGIVGNIVGVFSPNYTILYAENKKEELLKAVKQSMKIMGIIVNIPVLVLLVCGKEFYALWQPTVDSNQLYILSVISVGCIIISGGINCIYNIFTVVNKLKANSLVVIGSGLLSTLLVFVLLKTTSLGIYAIAGVSTAVSILRNLCFTAPYGAKCLNLKWYTFYIDILRPVVFVAVTYVISLFTISNFAAENYFMLVIKGIMILALSIIIGYFIFLNKSERKIVNNVVLSKLKKKDVK